MEFSQKLIALRRREGLSQEQLADQLGVTRQSVSKWESGTAMPELVKLIALSEMFGVSVDYMVKDYMEEQERAAENSVDTAAWSKSWTHWPVTTGAAGGLITATPARPVFLACRWCPSALAVTDILPQTVWRWGYRHRQFLRGRGEYRPDLGRHLFTGHDCCRGRGPGYVVRWLGRGRHQRCGCPCRRYGRQQIVLKRNSAGNILPALLLFS